MRLDKYYLDIAQAASQRSKCVSLKVGCVLVMDDKIVSTGLNGTHRGAPNCCDHFPEGNCEEHGAWSEINEIHAEMNAIIQAGRDLRGAWAFTTTSPCWNCLKHLLAAGITKIYYRELYWRSSYAEMIDMTVKCRKRGALLFKEGDDYEMFRTPSGD